MLAVQKVALAAAIAVAVTVSVVSASVNTKTGIKAGIGRLPVQDCTIIKDPAPLPKAGIVCGNPERPPIIANQWFDAGSVHLHTDFRGFQVYNGTYKGKAMFVANTGLGGPACAFLVEELIAHGVETIIRLGTNDYNVTEADLNNIYVLESVRGNWGLPRDYGIASDLWGDAIPADPELHTAILKAAKLFPNITTVPSRGYTIDGFYSFFDPTNVAAHADVVETMISDYQGPGQNCNCRDMESGALLTLGQLRGIRTASVLQAVIKSGTHHAVPGTIGIPVVLQALLTFA